MTAQQSTPSAAEVDAARLLLARLGVSPADLLTAAEDRPPAPTFADYIPVVRAAVTEGTHRVYESYWNRIVEHWGTRRLDEPTPTEIQQFAEYTKTHVVARKNPQRTQRRRTSHRCPAVHLPARRKRWPHPRSRQSRPEGHQASPVAVHPPRGTRHPACRDQPGRREHGQRSRAGHAHPAAAHRDRMPPSRRTRPHTRGSRPPTSASSSFGRRVKRSGGNRSRPPSWRISSTTPNNATHHPTVNSSAWRAPRATPKSAGPAPRRPTRRHAALQEVVSDDGGLTLEIVGQRVHACRPAAAKWIGRGGFRRGPPFPTTFSRWCWRD
jgi:hypothetical protein